MSRTGCRLAFMYLLSWSIFAAAGDPPLDPPPEPEAPPAAAPPTAPPAPPARPAGDPFQQTPLDRMSPNQRKPVAPAGDAILIQAAEFFRKKDYAQADLAFARAAQAKLTLSGDEKVAWGYCKLADLSAKAQSEADPARLQEIAKLTEAAKTLGGPRLDAAAKQLLERLAAKTATPVVAQNVAPPPAPSGDAVPEGWQGLETANFRVVWKSLTPAQAGEVAGVLETARSAMLARWTGSTASPDWKARCEVRVHADIAGLRAACPNGDEQGCSAVVRQAEVVVSRRMDLVAGGGDLLDSVVPREVTFLILSELFSDEPLSRWAEVGMTAMSESPAQVRRYRSTARKYQSSKALFPVATLVKMADFPDPARISEFYAQSVSMVEFLVRRKGAVEFASLLKETPRRGFEECLKRGYGFASLADFEAQFLRDLSGGK